MNLQKCVIAVMAGSILGVASLCRYLFVSYQCVADVYDCIVNCFRIMYAELLCQVVGKARFCRRCSTTQQEQIVSLLFCN